MIGRRRLEGSVYPAGRSRAGETLWARAEVTVGTDGEPWRLARVRFSDVVDPALRRGLEELRRRRGVVAVRLAKRLGSLMIVGWDAYEAGEWRLVTRLEEAVAYHGSRSLLQTEFGLWVISASGPGLDRMGCRSVRLWR